MGCYTDFFLGAPKNLGRPDVLRWHITTRNFFAWIRLKPLVGESLGQALVDLLERMIHYRGSDVDNVGDLLAFMDELGYSNFVDCPNLALAALHFADTYRLKPLWMNSFVHCVGMQEWLTHCCEFEVRTPSLQQILA